MHIHNIWSRVITSYSAAHPSRPLSFSIRFQRFLGILLCSSSRSSIFFFNSFPTLSQYLTLQLIPLVHFLFQFVSNAFSVSYSAAHPSRPFSFSIRFQRFLGILLCSSSLSSIFFFKSNAFSGSTSMLSWFCMISIADFTV
jgi:hypothetical protein